MRLMDDLHVRQSEESRSASGTAKPCFAVFWRTPPLRRFWWGRTAADLRQPRLLRPPRLRSRTSLSHRHHRTNCSIPTTWPKRRCQSSRWRAGRPITTAPSAAICGRDGSAIWVLVSASALRDETTGELHYTIVQASTSTGRSAPRPPCREREPLELRAGKRRAGGLGPRPEQEDGILFAHVADDARHRPGRIRRSVSRAAWLARIHPEDRERIRAQHQRQDTGELTYNEFEYRERHRDGHWIWILSRGKPVAWNPDGTPSRILGTDTDITSLKAGRIRSSRSKRSGSRSRSSRSPTA